MTLYRRQGSKSSPRERNAKRQNGCLKRAYKLNWEKKRGGRQRWKGKIYPCECKVPKNSKERFLKKKAFLSDKWKETEENNRMGKTRDLFKKIREKKGTLQAKMGTIKDRNGMDLTEAEDIKKRWQHKQNYTKRIFMTQITTMMWSLTQSQTVWSPKSNGS